MRLLELIIGGFRSFGEQQELDFTSMSPGLYHVKGVNRVEPDLEANGTGKTSLFEVPYWVLYGKTSRGLKAGALKNWHSKESCSGLLHIQTETGPMLVSRQWQPNALEISRDGGETKEPVDQSTLEKLIGISPAAFLHAVYFAQFTPSFIDLEPSQQTAIFSSVLNLGMWEQAAAKAGEKVREFEQQAQRLREESAKLQGQAEELLKVDYEEQEKAWTKEQSEVISDIRKAFESSEKSIKKLEKEYEATNEIRSKLTTAQQTVENHYAYLLQQKTAEQQLSKTLARLQDKDIKKCPTCGAPMSNKHISEEIEKTQREIKITKKVVHEADAQYQRAVAERSKLVDQQKKVTDISDKLISARSDAKNAERRLTELKREKNPYTTLKLEAEKRGEKIVNDLEVVEEKLDACHKTIAGYQYWAKAFKEIRLWLIKESLAQLTIEANEVLFQLGLHDWTIEFDVERETKSGTVSKGFTVMVKAPHTDTAVPWEAWSGGESQRLRLSVSMGFSNLICSRLGIQPNIEFWDEPSSWLSDAGINDMLTVLAERAKRYQKIILLADHRALDFGGFAGTITVTKEKKGSFIS